MQCCNWLDEGLKTKKKIKKIKKEKKKKKVNSMLSHNLRTNLKTPEGLPRTLVRWDTPFTTTKLGGRPTLRLLWAMVEDKGNILVLRR